MGNCGGSEKETESRAMRMHKERLQIEKEERETGGSFRDPAYHGSLRMSHGRRRSTVSNNAGGAYHGRSSMTSATESFRARRSRGGNERLSFVGPDDTVHIQQDDLASPPYRPRGRSFGGSSEQFGDSQKMSLPPQSVSVNGGYDRTSLKSSMRATSPQMSPAKIEPRDSFSNQPETPNSSDTNDEGKVNNSTVRFELSNDEISNNGSPNDSKASPRSSPKAFPASSPVKPRRPPSPSIRPTSPLISGRTSPGPSLQEFCRTRTNDDNMSTGSVGRFRRDGSFDGMSTGSMRRRYSVNGGKTSLGPSRRGSRVNL